MKKTNTIFTIILAVLTIASGTVTYILYKLEKDVYKYVLILSLVFLIFTLSFIISSYRLSRQIKRGNFLESRLGLWNTISYRVKKSGEHAFNELPIGIVILSNKNQIVWSNNFAKHIFSSELKDINLSNISPQILKKVENNETNFETTIYGHRYEVYYEIQYKTLYLTDVTEISKIKENYEKRITAIGYINVDNLENILSDFDVQERAEFMYRIVSKIAEWSDKFGSYVRAYSDNSYLIIMDKSQLAEVINDNFSILDSIKDLVQGKLYKISLSIGVACSDIPIKELSELAKDQLELAMNRGGDQATVLIDDKVRHFGAKNDTAQSISSVEMRMKSEELQELMKASSDIMVVGHANADADAFGATIAIYRMAKALGKDAYIIFDPKSIDPTVTRIYESIKKDYVELLDVLIPPQIALARMTDNTLLMVVDLQLKNLLSEPKLVEKAKRIGVIDHHRRGDNVIDNLSFYLSSTAASSSVELIVQLYQYMPEDVYLEKLEATWMLLGINVDTNNFLYRCNENTFKVASYLSNKNANMSLVKKYLKEDQTEKTKRNKLINELETYQGHIGIAKGDETVVFKRAELAKISDEIVSIEGIDVGFTIGRLDDDKTKIGISARSIENVNVQIIMEAMHGGGHFNNAAAQIRSESIDEVVKQLKLCIDEYMEKEESMKVILIKDVKNHGKKGEIVEFAAGFANHLVRSGQAIHVTDENLKRLDEQKKQAELEEERLVQEMTELKKIIEETPIKIPVKVGAEGKIFGSINTKQIVEAFEKATGKVLNKQNIKLEKNIASLGTYEININLHKSINATITLYVVEKE